MNDCVIVLFGASGDLAKRKLLPALYRLYAQKKMRNSAIIGVAFDELTAQEILERARPFLIDFEQKTWDAFKKFFHYCVLNFITIEDYQQLAVSVAAVENKYQLDGKRLFYCATASDFFCPITENLTSVGLLEKMVKDNAAWQRIVYEKPFGTDLHSAREINDCIARTLNEDQVYRIDHYLSKDIVGNIALVRFTNCVLEPLWNNRYVDQVQIILSEKIGIDERGRYFDKYGMLCDVVQNHMLELLALLAMEAPEKLTGDYIRNERAKVLEKIQVVDGLLGQYDGYQQEKDVAPHSTTDTFAALYLRVNNPRWAGVPFYLKTGKCLNKKETVMHIKFKQVDCLLAKSCPSEANYLTIRIDPDSSFSLSLNAKKPGLSQEVFPVKMEFCHSCLFTSVPPEAYEILFEEVMRGEESISVRFDEIEFAWKVIEAVRNLNLPVYSYKRGSEGPEELETIFDKKHGLRWRS